jgi:hypothetical protein
MRIALGGALISVTLPFLILACGEPNVEVSEYDQSCEIGEDCIAVVDGDPCCGCPNAAVNKSESARYQAEVAECSALCDIESGQAVVFSCQEGKCTLGEGGTVCTPGESLMCQCQSGASGVKTCNDEGEAFSECDCDTACTPGEESFCACSGGGQGVKTCTSDGAGFGECTCN